MGLTDEIYKTTSNTSRRHIADYIQYKPERRNLSTRPKSLTRFKTPDKVQTEFLGDLEFFDGAPSSATVEKAYDFLDLSRGTTAFLKGIPAASVYALLEGLIQAGVQPGDLGITEDLMDARSLFLTPNSTDCLQLCGN